MAMLTRPDVEQVADPPKKKQAVRKPACLRSTPRYVNAINHNWKRKELPPLAVLPIDPLFMGPLQLPYTVIDRGNEGYASIVDILPVRKPVSCGGGTSGYDDDEVPYSSLNKDLWAWMYANQETWGAVDLSRRDVYRQRKDNKSTIAYLDPPKCIPDTKVAYRRKMVHNFFEGSRSVRSLRVSDADEYFINAVCKWTRMQEFKIWQKGITYAPGVYESATDLSSKVGTEPCHIVPEYRYAGKPAKKGAVTNWEAVSANDGLYQDLYNSSTVDDVDLSSKRERYDNRHLYGLCHYLGRLKHGVVLHPKRKVRGRKIGMLDLPGDYAKRVIIKSGVIMDLRQLRSIRLSASAFLERYGDIDKITFFSCTPPILAELEYNIWLSNQDDANKFQARRREYLKLRHLRDTVAFRHFTIYIFRLKREVDKLIFLDKVNAKIVESHVSNERSTNSLLATLRTKYREKFMFLGPVKEGYVATHALTGKVYQGLNNQWVLFGTKDDLPIPEDQANEFLVKKLTDEFMVKLILKGKECGYPRRRDPTFTSLGGEVDMLLPLAVDASKSDLAEIVRRLQMLRS